MRRCSRLGLRFARVATLDLQVPQTFPSHILRSCSFYHHPITISTSKLTPTTSTSKLTRKHQPTMSNSVPSTAPRTVPDIMPDISLANVLPERMSADIGPWGAWMLETAPFTRLVVDCMRNLYPEELADRSWDNVGLLLGNSKTDARLHKNRVIVCNDLTYQVASDAVASAAGIIVSYHPFIFSGLKSITNRDPQQATLLHLARYGVAVYCPHTAVDAAPEGLNTWLADIVSGPHKSKRSIAKPIPDAPDSHSPAGYGAIGHFEGEPVPLVEIIKRVAEKLGGLRHVMVATPIGAVVKDTVIRSFGVCAGSGYDVLKKTDVDLIVTGETSHHSALSAIQQGKVVITVFHSNSERGYLQQVLAPKLEKMLKETLSDAEVLTSHHDRDPFTILNVSEL